MKRRLLIIAIFLLAGAVVNVAVAWGCALGISLADVSEGTAWRGAQGGSTVGTFSRPGGVRVKWYLWPEGPDDLRSQRLGHFPVQFAPSWARFRQMLLKDRVRETVEFEGRGWPMVAMWSQPRGYYDTNHGERRMIPVQGGIETPLPLFVGRTGSHARVLPLRPFWPGFAFNTLFYATLLWLLIPGPFALRRFLRVRRGLCPKCAYPTGESSVCTECGRELP